MSPKILWFYQPYPTTRTLEVALLIWQPSAQTSRDYLPQPPFLEECEIRYPGDTERVRRMSLIDETGERYVRMANLACVGSHAINGVAQLHRTVEENDSAGFLRIFPKKFSNKTNGVTPRWMVLSNPKLTNLITQDWKTGLSTWKNSSGWKHLCKFRREWWQIKHDIKRDLAAYIHKAIGHCGESRVAIRHPSETHSRVQAATPECAAHHYPLQPY